MRVLALLLLAMSAVAADLSTLIADREAVERVYYNHRLGDKPPFEKTLTRDQLRSLVERDLAKETALKKRYGTAVTDAQITAEVARVDSTTRAPEILAEIKAALANDPSRFARTVARPLVVERLLRARFQEDDALHLSQRRVAEHLRASLLAARDGTNGVPRQLQLLRASQAGDFTEKSWRLDRRSAATNASTEGNGTPVKSREHYFDELPKDLQDVLRAQLNAPGDVSAVIETPDGFLVFVAKIKRSDELATGSINIPKRDYDEWIAEQVSGAPSRMLHK